MIYFGELVLSVALMQQVPAAIPAVNAPTENAQAVYLVDDAARQRGDRSQLAVLGTYHLRNLPEGFDTNRFVPLVEKLEAWAPDRIAIESIWGPQCEFMRAYAFEHGDTAERFCPDPTAAQDALGMSGPEAAAEIEDRLREPLGERPPSERRRLAALFLAVGEPASALVQWLRLPEDERHAEDGLIDQLVEDLNQRAGRQSENSIIAAPLAAALGHERLYHVDDQSFTAIAMDFENYGNEMQDIGDMEWAQPRRDEDTRWIERLQGENPVSVLDWYRWQFNAPEYARLAMASDFAAAAGAKTTHNSGRKYLAYWETRNLRMAANIRNVISAEGRVLAIVGASHKAHYERYLGVTSDVEIVDMQALLQ